MIYIVNERCFVFAMTEASLHLQRYHNPFLPLAYIAVMPFPNLFPRLYPPHNKMRDCSQPLHTPYLPLFAAIQQLFHNQVPTTCRHSRRRQWLPWRGNCPVAQLLNTNNRLYHNRVLSIGLLRTLQQPLPVFQHPRFGLPQEI